MSHVEAVASWIGLCLACHPVWAQDGSTVHLLSNTAHGVTATAASVEILPWLQQ